VQVRCDSGLDLARRIGVDEPGLGAGFDEVLIDCPPTIGEQTLDILTAGDLLLIPTRPAWPDIWALERVAVLLEDLRTRGSAPRATIVFNQVRDEDLRPFQAGAAELGFNVSADRDSGRRGLAGAVRGRSAAAVDQDTAEGDLAASSAPCSAPTPDAGFCATHWFRYRAALRGSEAASTRGSWRAGGR
jgi:hypothetical protein